jgi:SP family galactose:H+ symporter-like MFS transporter
MAASMPDAVPERDRDAEASSRQQREQERRTAGPTEQGQTGHITAYIYLVACIAALGGLLFGYDTGVVSGAQHSFVRDFHLSATQQELAVSAVLIGALIGALVAGKAADLVGRRVFLIVMGVVFGAGAILTALAPSYVWLVLFRVLVGVGVGGASVGAPMYTTERVPARVRGQLVFLFQVAITFGIVVSYVIDLWFANMGLSWRTMFGVAVIPALALAIGMYFLNDTPRWYASKGHWDKAYGAMLEASGNEDETRAEIQRIRSALEQEARSHPLELLRPGLRVALLVGVGLAILQQFVGINTIIYYAPVVLGNTGIGQAGNSLVGALIVGIMNFLTTIIAVFLVDRIGRRPLLFVSSTGMLVSLVATGALFALGPHTYGVLLLIAVMLYIVSFAIGFGPVFWLLSSEIFPTRLRAAGESMSAFCNWSANFLVSATFLTLINGIGASVTFWIFAFFALVSIIFTYRFVPETKNKPLEQIEVYWRSGRDWAAAARAARAANAQGQV